MNETVQMKLKVIVERAVRPLEATISRKKKLREELLAHVTGVFEDELPRCSDEAAALVQTETRFGDQSELAQKLQESVPLSDRTAFYFERWIGPRPGESLFGRSVRHGFTSLALEAGYFVVLSPLVFVFWKPQELATFISCALLISVGFGLMMSMSTLLINGLERTLFVESGRSIVRSGLMIVFSCVVPVLLYLCFACAVSLFMADDFKTFDLTNSWRIPLASVVFTGLIVWLANRSFTDTQYREEWGMLKID